MITAFKIVTGDIHDLYEQAGRDTGVAVDFEDTIRPAIEAGNVLFYHGPLGKLYGFMHFIEAHLPDTNEHVLLERMLYCPTSSFAARSLINQFELEGLHRGCDAVLAGSSLDDNEAARRLYQASGWKTNYAFRKDIKHV